MVLYLEQHGQGPRRVAGRKDDRHARIADRDLLAVHRHDVALRLAVRVLVHRLFDHLPIAFTEHDPGAVMVLHQLGATVMVAVGVTDDHVFDGSWVEAELSQSAHDGLLGRIVEKRIDQDDAFTRDESPGRVIFRADEIEVVEHLRGVDVPGFPRRRRTGCDIAAGRGLRRHAETGKRAGEIESGCGLGRRETGLDLVGRLRGSAGNA